MTGDNDQKETEEDVAAKDATDENEILESADEAFANTIVEASIDDLVKKIDETDAEEAARKRRARKRLEELREQQSMDSDDTFNFDLDDEI